MRTIIHSHERDRRKTIKLKSGIQAIIANLQDQQSVLTFFAMTLANQDADGRT